MIWTLLACAASHPEGASLELKSQDRTVFVGEGFTLKSKALGVPEWDMGDGTTLTGFEVTHDYDAPGIYTVSARVERDGQTLTEQLLVTAVWEPLEEAPRAASAVVADEEAVYAVLQDHDRVAVVSRLTRRVVRYEEACEEPRSLDLRLGNLLMACRGGQVGSTERFTVDVFPEQESRPFAAMFRGDDSYVVSTEQGLWHSWKGSYEHELDDLSDIRALAVSEGQLIVARFRGQEDGLRVWVAGEELLLEPDPGPDSDTDARGHLGFVNRIAVRPDGRAFVLGGNKANTERGLVRDGLSPSHDTTVRADLRHVGLHPDEVDLPEPAFDNRDMVSAMAYSPMGDRLYVAHHGSGIVDVLNPWTMQRMGGWQGLGAGLEGLVAVEGEYGVEVWALNRLDRTLIVLVEGEEPMTIDLVAKLEEPVDSQVLEGRKIFYDASDRRMSRDSYVSCGSCHLDGESDNQVWDFTDRGEGLRNTTWLLGNSGLAPLHWSANFDEVQDFEHDIRGPQQGTGFLSEEDWEATNDTLGEPKAGLSEELDALAAFVESLSGLPPSPHAHSEEGEAVFLAFGCADCHSGERFTDSGFDESGEAILHDIGTISDTSGMRMGGELVGLDTPTLRGLWLSAPYLHDGSAATLEEVLVDRNPEDLHGRTSELSSDEIGALVDYLLSLD